MFIILFRTIDGKKLDSSQIFTLFSEKITNYQICAELKANMCPK